MFELVESDTLKPHDYERIGKQRAAIFSLMSNGGRWTLSELERVTGYPQASISARLRDFRKPKFGGHIVRRERIADCGGTYEYRLEVRCDS